MINAYWWNGVANFGDIFTPLIIERFSGEYPIRRDCGYSGKILCCGSIANDICENDVVFGSGILTSTFAMKRFKNVDIRSVRGPLTRNALLNIGYTVPEIYGDPMLFAPYIFNVSREKKIKLGLIPHYLHYDLLKKFDSNIIKVIDVKSPCENVARNCCECEIIISSSLHGIILAESFNIPALWLVISPMPLAGNFFKFEDYYLSTNRKVTPIIFNDSWTTQDLLKISDQAKVCDTHIDLLRLLKICPFNKRNIISLDQIFREKI